MFFVKVKLLQGFAKPLTYKIPDSWDTDTLEGTIITVPLKNTIVPALVIGVSATPPRGDFEIKSAVGKDHLPQDPQYSDFIKKISQFYFVPQKLFYQRIIKFIHTKPQQDASQQDFYAAPSKATHPEPKEVFLTAEQQATLDYITPFIKTPQYAPTLVHGVTGSGKTEIYKKIIVECIAQNKSVLFLLPEVSLSLQFERLFEKQLSSSIPIYSFHSATKASAKKNLWNHLLIGKPCLIIGVHLPTMLPIPRLGCIIVDEEHEVGFCEKKHPKINSKEIALWRAKLYDIPILLGSATPSICSYHQAKEHHWKLFRLTKRFSGNFPEIKTVRITSGRRKSFWITQELEDAIADRLEKKEQALIYINRRGFSFFVQCKTCGYTFLCPNCSVSLTLHKNLSLPELCCHYCGHKQKNPSQCPECKAGEKELLSRGIGTQQIVTILQELFPAARIERADLDSTKKKLAWEKTVDAFEKREIDILVGTQTITKGYHFPHVTLVGIIWSDLNVHFPVYNAAETTLQKLIQVAGRAGRQSEKSLVIAQIVHDHPIFKYLNEEQYLSFCEEELRFREETLYPPFGRFVHIELKHINPMIIDADAQKLSLFLASNTETISVLGPTKPLVHRIQKTEIRQIFLKSKSFKEIYDLLQKINPDEFESQIFIVPTG